MSVESSNQYFFKDYNLKASVYHANGSPKKLPETVRSVVGEKGGCVGIRFNKSCYVSGRKWTDSGHWVAILGYKEEDGKEKMFIADPGHKDNQGWYDIDYFSKISCMQYITSVVEK